MLVSDKLVAMPLQGESLPPPSHFGQGCTAKSTRVEPPVAVAEDAASQRSDQSIDTLFRHASGREPRSLQPPDRPQRQVCGEDAVADLHREYRLPIGGRRVVLRELVQVGKLHRHPPPNRQSSAYRTAETTYDYTKCVAAGRVHCAARLGGLQRLDRRIIPAILFRDVRTLSVHEILPAVLVIVFGVDEGTISALIFPNYAYSVMSLPVVK